MAENIILIGFMGVGKGRTARQLSSVTGFFAVDTDDLIESMAKMKIRKIFSNHGESYFRQLEQNTATWLERNVSDTIVSTGGGFFTVNNISNLGHVVYLHSSVEAIISAIQAHPNAEKKIKKRPLLQDLSQATDLYKKRLPHYRKAASFEVNVEGKDIGAVAEEIIEHLKLY